MRQGLTIAMLAGALFFLSCSGEAQSSERKSKSGRPRTVVLELFTSQGCSSCPPADALLSKLRREDFGGSTVIPLAYHVDYWNHLGWSDPFSSARWSQRQNQYAQSLKNNQIYTPQLIINGGVQLVGSANGPIHAAIERQLEGADRGEVFIDRVALAGNEIKVDLRGRLDARASGGHAKVVVVLFENGVTTTVESGENARKKLTNDAIVRWQEGALDLSANGVEAKSTVSIPLAAGWRTNQLGVAAFIQDTPSLAIEASTARGILEMK